MAKDPTKLNKSQDFKYFFANSFGLSGNENEATIFFGFTEPNFEGGEPEVLQQSAVILTPKGAKALMLSIGKFVENLESANGPIAGFEDFDFEESGSTSKS